MPKEKKYPHYKEMYRRPCFAICANCGKHGVILFKDDTRSRSIKSIAQGQAMLKEYVEKSLITPEDAQRIENQLLCSDMPDDLDPIIIIPKEIMDKKELILISIEVLEILWESNADEHACGNDEKSFSA